MSKTIPANDAKKVKRGESVFLSCGLKSPVINRLSIAGTWRTFYTGEDDDPPLILGPGMKPRSVSLDNLKRMNRSNRKTKDTHPSARPKKGDASLSLLVPFADEQGTNGTPTQKKKKRASSKRRLSSRQKERRSASASPRVPSRRKSVKKSNSKKKMSSRDIMAPPPVHQPTKKTNGKLPKWKNKDESAPGIVYARSHAPRESNRDDIVRGVWKTDSNTDDLSEQDFMPQVNIQVHPLSPELREAKSKGIWGTNPAFGQEDIGHWTPDDIWFFPPGADPDDDSVVRRGQWSIDPRETRTSYPFLTTRARAKRRNGNLPAWETNDSSFEPQCATVHASDNDLPKQNDDGTTRGLWKTNNPDSSPSDWEPQVKVLIYPKRAKLSDEKGSKSGFWCTPIDATADEDGHWDRRDILFFPPGEKPDKHLIKRGRWVLMGDEWPPLTETAKSRESKLPEWEITDNWKPQDAKVYVNPKDALKENNEVTRGAWKSDDPSKLEKWESETDVIVHPLIAEPDDDKPHGLWCTDPNARADNQGKWNPKDVFFFPPGEEAEDSVVPRGYWSLSVGDWPPLKSKSKKSKRESKQKKSKRVSKLQKWHTPEGLEPPKANVHSKEKDLPDSADGGNDIARGLLSAPEKAWEPESDLLIHPLSSNLDDDNPSGLVCAKPDAEAGKDGKFYPEDAVVVAAGEDPEDKLNAKLPKWDTEEDFAPEKGKVYCNPKDVSESKDGDKSATRGLWNAPEKDWEPETELLIYPLYSNLDDDKPSGLLCTKPDSEAGDDGKYDLEDVVFLSPGEKAKDGLVPKAKWTSDWPPLTKEAKAARNTNDWKPQSAMVFPQKHSQDLEKQSITSGVWMSSSAAEIEHPQQVLTYPMSADVDKTRPQGVFCTNPESRADDKGEWDPKNLWFYPPGEAPPDGLIPRGKWGLPPGELEKWSPRSSKLMIKQRSVGSLGLDKFAAFDKSPTVSKRRAVGSLSLDKFAAFDKPTRRLTSVSPKIPGRSNSPTYNGFDASSSSG